MSTTNHTAIADDLTARWRPSDAQVTQADAMIAALGTGGSVYTVHLLVNKSHGWWTTDVEVVALDGVFVTREAATTYLATAGREYHDRNEGQALQGGYTWHNRPGGWAVFEDILVSYE